LLSVYEQPHKIPREAIDQGKDDADSFVANSQIVNGGLYQKNGHDER